MFSIYTIVFLAVTAYMIKDFKKSFIMYAVLKLLLSGNLNVVNFPGWPLLTIELLCNFLYLTYYFFFVNTKKFRRGEFPLKGAFKGVIASILISTFLSTAGLSSITRATSIIVNEYLFVYLLWKTISNISDLKYLFKGLLILFSFLFIYGVVEWLIGFNPVIEYQIMLSKEGAQFTDYGDNIRLGFRRVQSAIVHPIGYGIMTASMLASFAYLITRYKNIFKVNIIFSLSFITLGLLNLFFTNSRSPLILLGITALVFLNFKRKSTYYIITLLLLSFVLGYQFIEPYILNILSIINPDEYSNIVGGSSIDLRLIQFATAFIAVRDHIFFGLGIESVTSYVREAYPALLGLESVWLWRLVERGLFGIITHIYLLGSICLLAYRKKNYFLMFYSIAWIVTTSLTSTPGTGFPFFMTIFFLMYELNTNKYFLPKK